MRVKSLCKLQDAQKTRINGEIRLGPPARGYEKCCTKITVGKRHRYSASQYGQDNSRKAVISIAQTNNGILCSVMPDCPHIKDGGDEVRAPSIDDAPAKCGDNIAISIDIPGVPSFPDIGG